MRISLVVHLSVVFLGCVATRYSPSLDEELTADGSRFLATKSVIVLRSDARGNEVDELLVRTASESDGTITVLRNASESWPGRGFQCFEPMLYVLTLGVIPADCTNDYSFEATLESESGVVNLHQQYSVTQIQGWVSGLLVLLPAWELGCGEPSSRRAFNTVVNRISASSPPP